jgi:ribosomal protein RSM22 (predicted rRNA methylase)
MLFRLIDIGEKPSAACWAAWQVWIASQAMAQLNTSKFLPSVQKVTQIKKIPLLPG